jgi:hypothetical protein
VATDEQVGEIVATRSYYLEYALVHVDGTRCQVTGSVGTEQRRVHEDHHTTVSSSVVLHISQGRIMSSMVIEERADEVRLLLAAKREWAEGRLGVMREPYNRG